MGHKKNKLEASEAGDLRGAASRNVPARPRLGASDDPWSTVLKDVVREAPKTALLIAGTVLLMFLSLITYLIGVFAGFGAAAPPPHPTIQHTLQVVLEAAWRTAMNGG